MFFDKVMVICIMVFDDGLKIGFVYIMLVSLYDVLKLIVVMMILCKGCVVEILIEIIIIIVYIDLIYWVVRYEEDGIDDDKFVMFWIIEICDGDMVKIVKEVMLKVEVVKGW